MISNIDIRTKAQKAGVMLWQIAARLGYTDSTLSKKLRFELSAEEKARIEAIITDLEREKSEELKRRSV